MNEIPSATRGIIGAPMLCLLAGIGFAAALRALRFLAPRRRWGVALQAVAALAAAGGARRRRSGATCTPTSSTTRPTRRSPRAPSSSAIATRSPTWRASAPTTTCCCSAPPTPISRRCFAQFYRPIDPRDWAQHRDTGYLIIKPEEFVALLSPTQRVLAGAASGRRRPVQRPQGQAAGRGPGRQAGLRHRRGGGRKRYLNNWLILGLFPNDDGRGSERDSVDPDRSGAAPATRGWPGGRSSGSRRRRSSAAVDLNRDFVGADPRNPGNPEHVCAYAATTVRAPTARAARARAQRLPQRHAARVAQRPAADAVPDDDGPRAATARRRAARRRQRPAGAELRGHRHLVVQRPPHSTPPATTWKTSSPSPQLPVDGDAGAAAEAADTVQLVEGFAGIAAGHGRDHTIPTTAAAAPRGARGSRTTAPSAGARRRAGRRRAGGLRLHRLDLRRGGRLRPGDRRPADADLPEPPRSRGAQLERRRLRPWSTCPRAAPPAAPASICCRCRPSRSPPGVPLELRVTGSGGDPAALVHDQGLPRHAGRRARHAGAGGRGDPRHLAHAGTGVLADQ